MSQRLLDTDMKIEIATQDGLPVRGEAWSVHTHTHTHTHRQRLDKRLIEGQQKQALFCVLLKCSGGTCKFRWGRRTSDCLTAVQDSSSRIYDAEESEWTSHDRCKHCDMSWTWAVPGKFMFVFFMLLITELFFSRWENHKTSCVHARCKVGEKNNVCTL